MTEVRFTELGEEDEPETAQVLAWRFKEGDAVAEGDELAELLTDKAAFTVPAPAAGVLARIVVPAGGTVRSGGLLGEIAAAP